MSFRTVVITRQSKISYKNRFLVVKQENDEKYIHLSEIDTVIVDSISVSISAYLLKELADNKINIIFCDEKHNPFGEIVPYYSKHNTSKIFPNPSNLSLRGDFSFSMSCNISAIDPIFVLIPIAVTLNLPLPFNTLVPM